MIDKMRELITNYVDVSPAEISEDSKFIDDLGFNSYDFMSFPGEIEDEFDIEVDTDDLQQINTVGDLADYITKQL